MKRKTTIVRATLLALALFVGGAFAYGMGAAAAPVPGTAIPPCYDRMADGPCATQQHCRDRCRDLGRESRWNYCNTSTFCCYCDAMVAEPPPAEPMR